LEKEILAGIILLCNQQNNKYKKIRTKNTLLQQENTKSALSQITHKILLFRFSRNKMENKAVKLSMSHRMPKQKILFKKAQKRLKFETKIRLK
jgi:hypothetical protein